MVEMREPNRRAVVCMDREDVECSELTPTPHRQPTNSAPES